MKKLLRKIYNAVVPVSKKEFNAYTENMSKVLDGVLLAIGQQSEMSSSIINQISGLQMRKTEQQEKKEVEYDEAFQ